MICLQNDPRLGVLNGDLATVINVDTKTRELTIRLDRDPDIRILPKGYLSEGHVDHGYALTGHKAQGITVDRTFIVISGAEREWAYVALSRGRKANALYAIHPDHAEPCNHVAHVDPSLGFNDVSCTIGRSRVHTAAIDHQTPEQAVAESEIELLQHQPMNAGAEPIARAIARGRSRERQLEQRRAGIGLAIGR